MTTQEQEYPFTEGPWKVIQYMDDLFICAGASVAEKNIANVINTGGKSHHANADLLAKAPDMFLLIRDLVDAMDMAEIPPVNNDLYKRCVEFLKVGKV